MCTANALDWVGKQISIDHAASYSSERRYLVIFRFIKFTKVVLKCKVKLRVSNLLVLLQEN